MYIDVKEDATKAGGEGVTENEEGAGAVVEEEKDSGTVKFQVYKLYATAVGSFLTLLIFLSLLLMQVGSQAKLCV